MARSESGPEWGGDDLSDAELEAFRDAIGELGERVSEVLADGTGHTPEEIEAAVREYSLPDPLEGDHSDE